MVRHSFSMQFGSIYLLSQKCLPYRNATWWGKSILNILRLEVSAFNVISNLFVKFVKTQRIDFLDICRAILASFQNRLFAKYGQSSPLLCTFGLEYVTQYHRSCFKKSYKKFYFFASKANMYAGFCKYMKVCLSVFSPHIVSYFAK